MEVEEAPDENRTLELSLIVVVGLAILISWSQVLRPFISLDIAGLLAALLGAVPLFRRAYLDLRVGSITAEVAMTLGVIAALSIGEFLSAAIIAFLMLIAEFLEEFTVSRSRSAIHGLMEIPPKRAVVERNGVEVEVDISDVKQGDIVIVKSGERIPVDGLVVAGHASVNQAPITGESIPVVKGVDDEVFTGTINELGLIQVRATKIGTDTTLARIIELVEEAERSKAPIQRVADRFAAYFVPLVLTVSFLTFIATRNIRSSIAVVVVACPCAVALATPLAVVASVGKAAKKGIVVKGGIYLEELARADTVVMDKTGTLTIGKPRVTDIKGFCTHDEREILTLAASAETHSEHPLAKAILETADDYGVDIPQHQACRVIRGKGVVVTCNDQTLIVGNRELLGDRGIDIPAQVEGYMLQEEEDGKTAMLVVHDDEVCGVISASDTLGGLHPCPGRAEGQRPEVGHADRRQPSHCSSHS